jgi:hypothetical protein
MFSRFKFNSNTILPGTWKKTNGSFFIKTIRTPFGDIRKGIFLYLQIRRYYYSPQRPQRTQRVVFSFYRKERHGFAKDAMREPFNFLCVFRGLCSGALLTFSLRPQCPQW